MRIVKVIVIITAVTLLLSAIVFAAGLGLSTWTAVTEAIVDADLFAITDVSDETGSTSGTSKKATGTQLKTYFYASPTLVTPVIGVATGTSLITTGSIQGKIKVTNKSEGATLTSTEMDGMVFVTATAIIKLPPVIIGSSVCIYSTTAAAISLDPDDADQIRLNGVLDATPGDSITSASGAGDFVCVIGDSAVGWTTLGISGVWTAN